MLPMLLKVQQLFVSLVFVVIQVVKKGHSSS